ncbi:PGF-CTERM sorting domain-containing protein [Halorubrum sp. CGM5_25_10-8B]|uniref:BGTF surface domain-containing protein n=1 Tax=Halorubrum sp. CGM5_25_10-8B TaxID=2518115 RepID=UPI0010F902EB|nr:BGTF surface domain-containing protein [Halorubrum sp. CGM5_25_10-8B]TKX36472.1 PGF-CTERM sorting domain-containing protein [Halorubrum sp. CGM5_25_10-8B]
MRSIHTRRRSTQSTYTDRFNNRSQPLPHNATRPRVIRVESGRITSRCWLTTNGRRRRGQSRLSRRRTLQHTMTNDNTTRKKANAVFFAAVMVISMVAVGFAAAPAAASNHEGYSPANPYQGQDVTFTNDTLDSANEYELRRVTDTSSGAVSDSEFETELSVNDSTNTITIDTGSLDAGDYFVDDVGGTDLPSQPDNEDTFEVRVQSLSTEFVDDSVDNAGGTEVDLDLDSNRAGFNVTVTSDDFAYDDEELAQIFENYNTETSDADEEFTLTGVSESEIATNFSDIDAGDYQFEFNVTDTEASDAATITVNDVGDGELDIDPSSITEQQGDIVPITVSATEAASSGTLVIGNEDDVGYQANVSITDFGDQDEITIYFNSYAAGNTTAAADDIVWLDEEDRDEDANIDFDEVDDQTTGINMLDAGDYELAVSTASDDAAETLNSPDNVGTLFLEERSTAETINTWTVSDNVAGDIVSADDPVDALNNRVGQNVTQAGTIAEGDRVVHQIEASGLTGLLEATDSDSSTNQLVSALGNDVLDSNTEAGVTGDNSSLDLRLRETRESAGPNSDLRTVNIGNSTVDVVVDDEADTLYVIVDTDSIEFDNGDTLDASDDDVGIDARLRVQDARLLEYNRISQTDEDVDAVSDLHQSSTGSFTVTAADGEFDQDPYNVTNTEGQALTGTTNLAPGTELTLRVRSNGDTRPAFSKSDTVTVAADGTWSSEFDFSEQNVGDTYDVNLRNSAFETNPSVEGTVVEQTQEPANFAVSELSPQDVTATVGDTLTVSATVENTGGQEATQTVEFRVGGDAVASQDVTLGAGNSTTVEFADIDTSGLDAGDYEHGVFTDDDEQTATLTLEAADTGDDGGDDTGGDDTGGDDTGGDDTGGDDTGGDDTGGDDTGGDDTGGDDTGSDNGTDDGGSTDGSTPGFGAVVALVALIAAALLATRRND